MTELGHEELFPPTRLSAGCGFRKETVAGICRNGRDAPTAGILRVANNEGHGIIRRILVSRTMRDLVAGSGAAL
jgi:hypothetical protein